MSTRAKNMDFRQEVYYLLRTVDRLLAFTTQLSPDEYLFLTERVDDCVIALEKKRKEWEPDTNG